MATTYSKLFVQGTGAGTGNSVTYGCSDDWTAYGNTVLMTL